MKKLSRVKMLWKFVYSEVRSGRHLSQCDKNIMYYAKYAHYMKHHQPRVRSLELKALVEKQSEKNFIASLFKD